MVILDEFPVNSMENQRFKSFLLINTTYIWYTFLFEYLERLFGIKKENNNGHLNIFPKY